MRAWVWLAEGIQELEREVKSRDFLVRDECGWRGHALIGGRIEVSEGSECSQQVELASIGAKALSLTWIALSDSFLRGVTGMLSRAALRILGCLLMSTFRMGDRASRSGVEYDLGICLMRDEERRAIRVDCSALDATGRML